MDTLDKKYYKISDVAEMIDVPQSTLRYWEREFPECAPRRSKGNVRYYTPENIHVLRIIHFLLKVKGLKLEAAREQLRDNMENVSRRTEIIDRLMGVRASLEQLRKALNIRR